MYSIFKCSELNWLKISDVAQGPWFIPTFSSFGAYTWYKFYRGLKKPLSQIGPAGLGITVGKMHNRRQIKIYK